MRRCSATDLPVMSTRRLFLAAVTLLATTVPANAVAANPWTGGFTTLSDPAHQGAGPAAIFDDAGTAHVAWVGQGDDSALHVYATRRSPGDRVWAPKVELSGPGVPTLEPSITAGASGDVTVAWVRVSGGETKPETATRSAATGAWSTPERLPDTPGGNPGAEATAPNIVTDPAGAQTLVWREYGGHVVAVRRAGSSAPWGPAEIISDGIASSNPRVVAGDNGDVTVVFGRDDGSGPGTTTYIAGDGAWSAPETFAVSGGQSLLRLTGDGSGGDVAVWFADPGPSQGVYVMRRPAGGSWTGPEQIAGDGLFDVAADVAPLGGGDLLVTWLGVDPSSLAGGFSTVQASLATRTWSATTGSWANPVEVAPVAQNSWGVGNLVRLPSGDVAGVTQGRENGIQTVGLAVRDTGSGSWSPRTDLPGSSLAVGELPPQGTADDEGNVLVTWHSNAGRYDAHAAIADLGDPRLSGVSVPSSATSGTQTSMRADVSDRWSGIDRVSWDFGDDTTAYGHSVDHFYARAGTYTVTVTATDAAGNSTEEERAITVADPPPPPPVGKPEQQPKKTLAPLIEARLAGRTVTLSVKLSLKKGARCTGSTTATTAFGGRSYRVTLKLKTTGGTCRATGTIKLRKTPSLRTKLRISVTGKQVKGRTLTTRRG